MVLSDSSVLQTDSFVQCDRTRGVKRLAEMQRQGKRGAEAGPDARRFSTPPACYERLVGIPSAGAMRKKNASTATPRMMR